MSLTDFLEVDTEPQTTDHWPFSSALAVWSESIFEEMLDLWVGFLSPCQLNILKQGITQRTALNASIPSCRQGKKTPQEYEALLARWDGGKIDVHEL